MARLGLLVLGVAAALVVGGAAVWFLALRDTAEPASVEGAVTTFREGTETLPEGPSPVPEGVYVYATSGRETTDALTGVTHRYPSRSTITITRHECGVRMRWDVLEGRSTEWVFCVGPEGWTLAIQEERHTFFGRTERTTYTCSSAPFRPAGDEVGGEREVTCSTGSSDERGTARIVEHARVGVDDEEIDAVHVRRTSVFEGEIRGTSRHDVWLARETGVPVRVLMTSRTTNDSPIGDVHYEEDVSLRLTSTTPRR